jgi:YihY family inner membrane protein
VGDLVDRLDAVQRRRGVIGVPLAVVYKYFDDQGPYLAAILTYYTFVAIFPMMLIASSVLGFVLQGDEQLQEQLLDSALSQFPIVGTQLGHPEGLQGSASAVVIGSVTALYGVLGLGQAAQNAMNVVWAVPRNSRLNPFSSRARSLLGLVLGGVAVLAIATLSSFASNLGSFGIELGPVLRWAGTVVSVLLTAAVLAAMMRFTTSRRPSFRTSLPGALVIAVLWHGLQLAGGAYVRAVVQRASDVNGVFALVLGLIGLIFLAAAIAVLGLEVNVVLRERLWPRALLTPFTDRVHLTDADRRAYERYAKAQRYKGFQQVEVRFGEDPLTAGEREDPLTAGEREDADPGRITTGR